MKTIFMRKADWQKWDTLLRSGNYEQAIGKLYDGNNGYCCLGLLELALDGKVESICGEVQTLPSMEWLKDHGITFLLGRAPSMWRDPFLPTLDKHASGANDSKIPFPIIADAIKEAVKFTD